LVIILIVCALMAASLAGLVIVCVALYRLGKAD